MKRFLFNKEGFTLMEVLVSLVIISFLAGAMYTTFSQGLKLWRYAMMPRPEWEMDLFMEKFGRDLRSAFIFRPGSFKGQADLLEFSTLSSRVQTSGGSFQIPVQTRYYFTSSENAVYAEKTDYPRMLRGAPGPAETRKALEGVSGFGLEYYARDPRTREWQWKASWDADCLPRAVKLSLDLGAGNPKKHMRFFPVPASQGCA